jgi:hypothetical protein
MGLVKKASKLVQGVRRHRNELRSPRQLNEEKVNIWSTGRIGRFIATHKLRRHRTKVEAQTDASPENAIKAAMTQERECMHEHGTHRLERPRIPRSLAEPQRIHIAEDEEADEEEDEEEDDEEGDEEGLSEEDDDDGESEDEVEDSVIEDMRKLEENFRGISQKYRLINRIGEGDIYTYT